MLKLTSIAEDDSYLVPGHLGLVCKVERATVLLHRYLSRECTMLDYNYPGSYNIL